MILWTHRRQQTWCEAHVRAAYSAVYEGQGVELMPRCRLCPLSLPPPPPLRCITLHWEPGSACWEWSVGPREPGCIWLLHYRPFHWLGCTELMNWGSGQEHIIGRNEFLSQPSQEATGPGWSQQRPWLNGGGGGCIWGPLSSQKQDVDGRTWWSFRMLDQHTGEEPGVHRGLHYTRQLVLMISLVISVCFLLVTDTHGITVFSPIVYSSSPPEADFC